MCARHVARRQNETVVAGAKGLQEVAQRGPKARKAFKRAEFQHFVEQEGRRFVAAAGSGLVEKRECRVECLARRRGRGAWHHSKGRVVRDGGQEALWRRRRAFDIDVLTVRAAETF